MTEINAIERKIKTLKDQLDQVKGTDTEVYTRIVGYYRSVRNWNNGKRAEFKVRNQYTWENAKIPAQL